MGREEEGGLDLRRWRRELLRLGRHAGRLHRAAPSAGGDRCAACRAEDVPRPVQRFGARRVRAGHPGGPAWLRREPGRWQLLHQLQGSDPEAVHSFGCGGGPDREGDRQGAERSPEARQRDGADRAREHPGPRGGAGAAGVHRLPAQQALGSAAGAAEAGHREWQDHHPAGSHRLERDHPHFQVTM